MKHTIHFMLAVCCLLPWLNASAADANAVDNNALTEDTQTQIQQQIEQLQADYDRRLARLEKRQKQTQAATRIKRANNFNPAISLILTGTYASYNNDPDSYNLPGFALGEEAGLNTEGFSLGESEITLGASVDQNFYGQATFAIEDDKGETSIAAEEVFFETLGLSSGLKLKAGRFFSEMGYINSKHTHAWDFSDAPLIYRGLLGDQLKQDGLQFSWLLPTEHFIQLGAEAGNGVHYPSGGSHSGLGDWLLFASTGGDIGLSHSWQLGLSHWQASDINDRPSQGVNPGGNTTINTPLFSGDSKIDALDIVYKWAPDGNPAQQNFKFQWEYFQRHEAGQLSLDNTSLQSTYTGDQSGWYAQAVYQFIPHWKTGLRYDRLQSDNSGSDNTVLAQAGLLDNGHTPQRISLMLNWQASEFSYIRIQYNYDQSTTDNDNQLLIKYTIVMGAHGAHSY